MIYRIERKENPFVQVDKGFINDKRIGFKEKGILLYFLSRPNEWNFYEEEIASNSADGISAVKAGIKKLIETGYVVRGERIRDNKGQLGAYEYIVKEVSPTCENPTQVFPTQENPTLGNQTLINKDTINNNISNKDLNTSPIPPQGDCDEKFEKFYAAYPRHNGKVKAQSAFRRLKPNDALFDTIMKSVSAWSKTEQWTKDNHQYVPLPATWLNQKRWEDELPENKWSSHNEKGRISEQW